MNKKELVRMVSAKVGYTQKDVLLVIDAMFNEIEESLKEGKDVNLVGFGKFVTTEREARTSRNPKTGETVEVGSKKFVKFKPSQNLKKEIQ